MTALRTTFGFRSGLLDLFEAGDGDPVAFVTGDLGVTYCPVCDGGVCAIEFGRHATAKLICSRGCSMADVLAVLKAREMTA